MQQLHVGALERRREGIIPVESRDGGEIPLCAGRPFVRKRTGGKSRPAALGMTVVIGDADGEESGGEPPHSKGTG
jgi:hypothetical protein